MSDERSIWRYPTSIKIHTVPRPPGAGYANPEVLLTYTETLISEGREMCLAQAEIWAEYDNPRQVARFRRDAESPIRCIEHATCFISGGCVALRNGELNPFKPLPPQAIPAENLDGVDVREDLEIVMTYYGRDGVWVGQRVTQDLFVDVPVFGRDADQVYATVVKRTT